jgi:A/G-specific adenine glycosylase
VARITDIGSVRAALLEWYDAARRDLPWRRTGDPYAIWVSEVMLQQTQAERVEHYWTAFLDRFPSVEALARASEDEVLAAWSGLGYYARARRLREAARIIVRERDGSLPRTSDELLALPGMGEYTAAAVASLAFGEPAAVVDANVARAVSRLAGLPGDPSRGAAKKVVRDLARRLLDPRRPGDHNQAMMELGALVCLPRRPLCAVCPLRARCRAVRSGAPERFPGAGSRLGRLDVTEIVALVGRRGRILLVRGGHDRGWWEGLWLLPGSAASPTESPAARLAATVERRTGLDCRFEGEPIPFSYTVTRHRVEGAALEATDMSGPLRRVPGVAWFSPCDLGSVAVPAPYARLIRSWFERGGAAATRRGRIRRRGAPRSRRRS